MTKFYTIIKASLPLALYMHKQEKCQTFTQDAGVPISEATMVTTGTKAALAVAWNLRCASGNVVLLLTKRGTTRSSIGRLLSPRQGTSIG
jgi:hypothetical protein